MLIAGLGEVVTESKGDAESGEEVLRDLDDLASLAAARTSDGGSGTLIGGDGLEAVGSRVCQSCTVGIETPLHGRPLNATRRSGCGKGSGWRSTASRMLKMAVVAPMPRASVRMAVAAKPGLLRSWRSA